MALGYFSLGPDAERTAEQELGDYYAWLGDEVAGMIVASAAKDAETVQGYMRAFEELGCDELVLFPASGDPEQVHLLADAAGLGVLARGKSPHRIGPQRRGDPHG